MKLLILLVLISEILAEDYNLHVQYFRKPEEYAYFKLTDESGTNEWSTYVHMNKGLNLRENVIFELIKPLYDGPPKTMHFESASITRHIGKQFEYLLSKYKIDSMIFENLCSQMKPKFSKLLQHSEQLPSRIGFVIEHPTSAFSIPEGFRKLGVGREQFSLKIGERALLEEENFDVDSIKNTKNLTVRQGVEYSPALSSSQILALRAEELVLEGAHKIEVEDLKKLAQEWVDNSRELISWEIHIQNSELADHLTFPKNGTTLDIQVKDGRVLIKTIPSI